MFSQVHGFLMDQLSTAPLPKGSADIDLSESLSYTHIAFLTFQAVVEVVLICLSGFWAARTGLLNNEATKIISRLNVDLFTPALIFTKLASSLSLKKLLEIIIIPIFYAVTTGVSLLSSTYISKWLGLNEPEANFVTAMSVFGNSNSLPVSLTLALSYTLPGLEWDDIENDSADKIASRGILYLLIFQQLGQMLRWSWGYNKLLKKRTHKEIYGYDSIEDGMQEDEEQQQETYRDQSVIDGVSQDVSPNDADQIIRKIPSHGSSDSISKNVHSKTLSNDVNDSEDHDHSSAAEQINVENERNINKNPETPFRRLSIMGKLVYIVKLVVGKFLSGMNPPLWAMLISVFVASIPAVRHEFFESNGFVQNTLTLSIKQLGTVSIPLILVVLGANLAPSSDIPPACPHYARMVFGSLISRMFLPSLCLLPLITLCVKYVGLSIMDDPIFLIVAFILTTSPPAIQLSQICQLNELYQKEMAGVLFWGYVVVTLPVTIFIVVSSLECLNWARS